MSSGDTSSRDKLYHQATAMAMRAERCRTVAEMLDTRRAALIERHRPVVILHCEAVWTGQAATASRNQLQRVIGAGLYFLGLDLATTSRALLSEALGLDQQAAALRRQAAAWTPPETVLSDGIRDAVTGPA